MLTLLLVVLLLILAAEFVNGWTDSPNAIATVVSTRTLTPRVAILLATCLNIAGAFMGTAVATTIGEDIVKTDVIGLSTLGAAMVAIILWTILTWRFGLPTSKSHALVSSLSGAAIAVAGPGVLIWDGWSKVLLGLPISTICGAIGGFCVAKVVQRLFSGSPAHSSNKLFSRLQIVSASLMAYSHGSNDSQKFMGAFSLALVMGAVLPSFYVPDWVIILCAVTMGLGTSIGGMRIIRVMGFKIVHLETYQGFSAETAAASIIIAASVFGVPLSTTHTINMAIVGVGMARHRKRVHFNVFFNIIKGWLLTFPMCGLLGFLASSLYELFGIMGIIALIILFFVVVFFCEKAYLRFINRKLRES